MAPTARRRLVIASLVASLTLNAALLGSLAGSGGLRRILLRLNLVKPPSVRAPFQVEDEERFRLLPHTPAEVVFLGDSLIGDGPWAELYSDVHNRGIGGDRTDNVLARLDTILAGRPRVIVSIIGANDLSAAVPPAQVLDNYRAILERIRRESPATRVCVAAMLPVNPNMVGAPIYTNDQVRAVNGPLRELVAEFPTAEFFDLGDLLRDDKGDLRPEYSKDGLHLNLKGYLAVAERVGSLVRGR